MSPQLYVESDEADIKISMKTEKKKIKTSTNLHVYKKGSNKISNLH